MTDVSSPQKTTEDESDSQYYWFTPTQISLIREAIQQDALHTDLINSVKTEIQVSEVRAQASGLQTARLAAALGLENGSKPLWLSPEEYRVLKNIAGIAPNT